jgi:transcriptional regulator with XRE-family HTH domain
MRVDELGRYLKSLREAKSLTVRSAASLLGISASRLAEIERGRTYHRDQPTRPSRELVEQMASAYEMSQDILLTAAGYPPESGSHLSDDTRIMVSLYESLSPEQKALAIGILRLMTSSRQA